MDQQQGDGSGELAALPGILSGKGIGAMLRRGYVCGQEIILLLERPPIAVQGEGAFLFVARNVAVVQGWGRVEILTRFHGQRSKDGRYVASS